MASYDQRIQSIGHQRITITCPYKVQKSNLHVVKTYINPMDQTFQTIPASMDSIDPRTVLPNNQTQPHKTPNQNWDDHERWLLQIVSLETLEALEQAKWHLKPKYKKIDDQPCSMNT